MTTRKSLCNRTTRSGSHSAHGTDAVCVTADQRSTLGAEIRARARRRLRREVG
jgi:hypothetical protein